MRKILLTLSLLSSFFCVNIEALADTAYGFENNKTSETGFPTSAGDGSRSISSTEHRTGSYSLEQNNNNTSAKTVKVQNLPATFKGGKQYVHYICYIKKTANNSITLKTHQLYNGGAFASVSPNSAITTSWQRITGYGQRTGNTTDYTSTELRITTQTATAGDKVYLDDIVVYVTSDDVATDLTKPTSATSASATTSSISWTNGSDASTGIDSTLIFRRTSGSSDDLTLNDQGIYSIFSKRGATTDQSGHWTIVKSNIANDATSFSGTFSAGDRYAIVHRDIAYNYSTPTYVTVESGSCTVSSAEAGADKNTTVNSAVALAATAAGSGKTGTWSITSKPDGSTASTSSFSDVNSATATFTPDKIGDYTLTWTVECDDDDTETASDNMTVTAACIAISPSLSYASVGGTTLTVGDVSSGSPTVSGNTGSGAVTYSVTASSPSGAATVSSSTGVVTAVAAGSATVTASIAASGNYCANTATASFTIEDDCTDPGLTITLN